MIQKFFLPTTLFVLTSLMSLSSHSLTLPDCLLLAKECHTVSQKLAKLSRIQTEPACVSTLHEAETDTELAANYLENEAYHTAKNHLGYASQSLKHAITLSCENSLEIDVAKSELAEINAQLIDFFNKKL